MLNDPDFALGAALTEYLTGTKHDPGRSLAGDLPSKN